MVHVLSIIYVYCVLPTRWLACKTQTIAQSDFNIADIDLCVDLTEITCLEMAEDGTVILNGDFMMHIFEPITDKVSPFAKYLTMISGEKNKAIHYALFV